MINEDGLNDSKIMNELIDYWKNGYHTLYEKYDFEKKQNKALEEKNAALYKRIQELDDKIGLCVADIMERDNTIITLKRIIDEAHMNSTLGNH